MSAYTVLQLAHDAGVSVHVVRDYLMRRLLRPVPSLASIGASLRLALTGLIVLSVARLLRAFRDGS